MHKFKKRRTKIRTSSDRFAFLFLRFQIDFYRRIRLETSENLRKRSIPRTGLTNSLHLSNLPPSNVNEGVENLDEKSIPKEISLAETQFYARTSASPTIQLANEICSSPPADDTFHDAIDDLSSARDPTPMDKGKVKSKF